MGRLTKNFEDGNGNVKCFASCRSCNGCICTDVYSMIDKLAHYEDLEEQGKLIELPCAVGDTVWVATFDYTDPFGEIEYVVIEEKFELYMLKDFGVELFLTKEEAAAKLKELEGDKE